MIARRFILFLALLGFFAARPALAWNATGHQAMAIIAWDNLTPEAKQKITKLLAAHPLYADMLVKPDSAPPNHDRDVFLTAAIWPDLVRSPASRGAKYNHPNWHYVDFPYVLDSYKQPAAASASGTAPATKPSPTAQPDVTGQPGKEPTNAVQAFQKCLADLQNEKLPDADRAVALCWIEHLVGDIHQPLHAVSLFSDRFPTGDQGGNLIMVTANQSVTNLHALWDGMLGNYDQLPLIEQVAARAAAAHPRDTFTDQLKITDFTQWAKESFNEAKSTAYADGKLQFLTRQEQSANRTLPVPEVPPGYMDRAKTLAETKIALSGYRLANLLNGVFHAQQP